MPLRNGVPLRLNGCSYPSPRWASSFSVAAKSQRPEDETAKIEALVAKYSVLPCIDETAYLYGEIRDHLRQKGRPIPDNDVWIAAIAQQHDLTVATRDAHFREIEDLALLDW